MEEKDMKKTFRILIPVMATLVILFTAFSAFGHYKDVQAEKSLAERSAIPKTEITSVTKMVKNLGHRNDLQISVLVCKTINDTSRVYADKDIDHSTNIERQIALIALNPLDSALCEDDIYNIVGVEASWTMDEEVKITLKGDNAGWETVSWVSPNYGIESAIPNHPAQFSITQAENFKFEATGSSLITPSATTPAP